MISRRHYHDSHSSLSWAIEFTEIDSLPRPQSQPAIYNWYYFTRPYHGTFNVSGRVAFAVVKKRLPPGHHFRKLCEHVVDNIRIGIFINRNRRSRVWGIYRYDTFLQAALDDSLGDLTSDVHHCVMAWCLKIKFYRTHVEYLQKQCMP